MVKTRLQNWWDCVKKIFRNEGVIRGFYKGLLPQMIVGGRQCAPRFVLAR
jgi:hypothetical protein